MGVRHGAIIGGRHTSWCVCDICLVAAHLTLDNQRVDQRDGDSRRWIRRSPAGRLARVLGPGLITGAADDDPSGIATYSQAGAAYGYGQLWTLTICLPLMISVQEAAARIGSVTRQGLTQVTARKFPKPILLSVVAAVVIANTINIAADIAAVGAAANLLIPLPTFALAGIFTLIVSAATILVPYHNYARVLKILALALFAYVVTALIVAEPWPEIITRTFVPALQWDSSYWYVIVGIFGTTISPYMFFWQTSEEVEEARDSDRQGRARRSLRNIRTDVAIGMAASQAGSWFMMVTTATVLHNNGVTTISTAADAAAALEPLAQSFPNSGTVAKIIFAVGILGLGLLGVPVLAGSASYAVSELFGWREGLDKRAGEARGFYAVIVVAMAVGLGLTVAGIDPIRSLIFAAVVNGIVAVPLVLIIRAIGKDTTLMGEFANGRLSNVMLAITFVVMGACALALFASLL